MSVSMEVKSKPSCGCCIPVDSLLWSESVGGLSTFPPCLVRLVKNRIVFADGEWRICFLPGHVTFFIMDQHYLHILIIVAFIWVIEQNGSWKHFKATSDERCIASRHAEEETETHMEYKPRHPNLHNAQRFRLWGLVCFINEQCSLLLGRIAFILQLDRTGVCW